MIQLGTEVKSKTHDDLEGTLVYFDKEKNQAVVKTWIEEFECMTVETFLDDLQEVA